MSWVADPKLAIESGMCMLPSKITGRSGSESTEPSMSTGLLMRFGAGMSESAMYSSAVLSLMFS